MSIQFEWQVGSEDGQWETIAETNRRPRRKWPWWVWATLLTVVIILVATTYAILRRRYDEARQQIEFQIQSAIDLEARAYAQRDRDLFLQQQDKSLAWHARQTRRISSACLQDPASSPSPERQFLTLLALDRCAPVLPAKVRNVRLQGDIAWVEVIEGQDPLRRARFYVQTEEGWKHTAPRVEFWNAAIELTYGNVVFLYHRLDQPYIDPLIEHIHQVFNDVCRILSCPSGSMLTVNFVADLPEDKLPHLSDGQLLLPSPWLSGIPIDDQWDEAHFQELTYWVTYEAASQSIHSLTRRSLTRFQNVIAAEYAAWYSQLDPTQAPILGRVIERQSAAVLPAALRSLRQIRTLDSFMRRWLLLSPVDQRNVYFETLLNAEREAILSGRRETFLFLQEPGWRYLGTQFYDEARLDDSFSSSPPIQVEDVEIADGGARVTLANPLPALEGYEPMATGRYAFFRLRSGDWKHTYTYNMAFWDSRSSPTRTPTPSPVPSPTPTPNRSS
jgi:hypothetical protein